MTQVEVSVDSLVLTYGAVRAVDDVSFSVVGGEVCGLVGPNGSGKTSLLNGISGFIPVASGQIRLGGADLTRQRAHVVARHGVGRTFQLLRLLPGLTVAENVAAGYFYRASMRSPLARVSSVFLSVASLAEEEREHVESALVRVGLSEVADVLVDELSFGMQRRVEIARSIVAEPTLLLLDEPAAGLDERDLADLAAIISAEAARGCAVILVDHHLHFVLELCPRLIVLNFGNKIFDGPAPAAVEDEGVRTAYVGA